MHILVTGGAGYLGSTLVPSFLARGFDVTVVDNLLYGQAPLLDCCHYAGFRFIKGDICDTALMDKVLAKADVIIPLAAIVGAPACKLNPLLTRLVNLEAPLRMLKKLSSAQRLLFPTTNSGYGIGEKDAYCTEESPLKPISEYGRTKVEVEKACLDTGNAVTFRLATVFGVSPRMRMDLLVNDFTWQAHKNRALVLFEQDFRRNYIHVRDVAMTFLWGLDHYEQMRGQPYNAGLSEANLTKRQLAEKIAEHVPGLYIHAAEIGEDPDKRDYIVSNAKLESFGWKPQHTLDMGIRELLKAYAILKPNQYGNV